MTPVALSRLLIDERAGDQVIAKRKGRTISYSQFRSDVGKAAAQFGGIGTGALACQDSYNFCVGLFGLLHTGARVALPQNTQPSSLEALNGTFDRLIDDTAVEKLDGGMVGLMPLDSEKFLIDVFTSGSTGEPQKISKSLDNFQREIVVLEKLWGGTVGGGPVFSTVSHQHVFGLTFKLLWPLSAGRAFTAETHALWENLVASLSPGAILISSPAHISRLGGIVPLSGKQKLKAIFSAGAPLSVEAGKMAESLLGCAPTEIFGSSETGAIGTRSSVTGAPWQPMPGVEIRIDDEDRLHVRTPFAGNEWIATGDLAEASNGGFRSMGRADTIVKIEGKRVSLAAVEKILTALPEIDEAAAVLLPGKADRLAAAVVLSAMGKESSSRLGAFRFGRHLREVLLATEDAASIPRQWRFVDALPSQPMGKRRAVDIIALFGDIL